jgi:hypothetical protein
MRKVVVLIVMSLGVMTYSCSRTTRISSITPTVKAETRISASPTNAKVDFDSQIAPLLKSKCMPCHFSGGKVYDKLPFDRAQTIKTLGTKLFTRIHDENERKLIREFLSQE